MPIKGSSLEVKPSFLAGYSPENRQGVSGEAGKEDLNTTKMTGKR